MCPSTAEQKKGLTFIKGQGETGATTCSTGVLGKLRAGRETPSICRRKGGLTTRKISKAPLFCKIYIGPFVQKGEGEKASGQSSALESGSGSSGKLTEKWAPSGETRRLPASRTCRALAEKREQRARDQSRRRVLDFSRTQAKRSCILRCFPGLYMRSVLNSPYTPPKWISLSSPGVGGVQIRTYRPREGGGEGAREGNVGC